MGNTHYAVVAAGWINFCKAAAPLSGGGLKLWSAVRKKSWTRSKGWKNRMWEDILDPWGQTSVSHFLQPWQCRSFIEVVRDGLWEAEREPVGAGGAIGAVAAPSRQAEPADWWWSSQPPGIPGTHTELPICSFTSAFQISHKLLFWPCLHQKRTGKGFWET